MFNQMGGRGLLGRLSFPASNPYGVGAGAQALRNMPMDKAIPTVASQAQGLPGLDANGNNPHLPGSFGEPQQFDGSALSGFGMQMMAAADPAMPQMPSVQQIDPYRFRGQYRPYQMGGY